MLTVEAHGKLWQYSYLLGPQGFSKEGEKYLALQTIDLYRDWKKEKRLSAPHVDGAPEFEGILTNTKKYGLIVSNIKGYIFEAVLEHQPWWEGHSGKTLVRILLNDPGK